MVTQRKNQCFVFSFFQQMTLSYALYNFSIHSLGWRSLDFEKNDCQMLMNQCWTLIVLLFDTIIVTLIYYGFISRIS